MFSQDRQRIFYLFVNNFEFVVWFASLSMIFPFYTAVNGFVVSPSLKANVTANSRSNLLRIQTVERCFGPNGITLQKPGRLLLGEGIVQKVCRKGLGSRKILLFSDILVGSQKISLSLILGRSYSFAPCATFVSLLVVSYYFSSTINVMVLILPRCWATWWKIGRRWEKTILNNK